MKVECGVGSWGRGWGVGWGKGLGVWDRGAFGHTDKLSATTSHLIYGKSKSTASNSINQHADRHEANTEETDGPIR